MKILSHRGYWLSANEKNARIAFERTIRANFGTETDVRDSTGGLVASHDPPGTNDVVAWADVVEMFDGQDLPLAVNIKADGLADMLTRAFSDKEIPWFAFDMSAPEMLRFMRAKLPYFTRHSDIEPQPILYGNAVGVWLDAFDATWFDERDILRHLAQEKSVCVVSPELHGRDPMSVWAMLSKFRADDRVFVCTDRPHEAHEKIHE
jgi:hypothetical protein